MTVRPTLEFSAPARFCTVRAAVRRRAPGFFSGARLRAPAGAILEALSRTNCRVTIPRIAPSTGKEIVRARAGGGRARHTLAGTRQRTAPGLEFRTAKRCWTSATRWVCHMPLFPSGTVSHPGDMRAGEILGGTRSDKTPSLSQILCVGTPWGPPIKIHCPIPLRRGTL